MNNVFFNNFSNTLLNNKFSIIKNNSIQNINIYFKSIGNVAYVVVPIYNKLDYINIFNSIHSNFDNLFAKFNFSKIFFLQAIVSDDFSSNDKVFLNQSIDLDSKIVNICWGINTNAKKIITKSNQPTKLINIEKYIKSAFAEDTKKNTVYQKKYTGNPIVSKNTYLTFSLIYIIIIIHFLGSQNKDMLVQNFAISPNMIEDKQFYRFLTSMFLHSNLSHLLSNCLALYIFGTRAERYLGKLPFLIIYIFGGFAGGIASAIFTNSFAIGASGAIFAIEGAILYFSIKEKTYLDGLDFQTIFLMSMVGILFGFTTSNIDNSAHIGGFLAGFIISLIYYKLIYIKKNYR